MKLSQRKTGFTLVELLVVIAIIGVLVALLFVPMTGKAEAARQQQPDPSNPHLVNGSFEEEPNYKSEGGQGLALQTTTITGM